ncbi:MAG: DUF87 domain-containing protein [Dehalococcoidia bacterium]
MPDLHVGDDFTLDTERFADEGLRIGVFASSGAGKGYLLGVLLEELIEAGYPCVMVDPESELWTFRELGALVIGGPHGHLPLPELPALDTRARRVQLPAELGPVIVEAIDFCLETATPLVFDLDDLDEPQVRAIFAAVANDYWRAVNHARRPSVLAITESHIVAPQSLPHGETPSTVLSRILSGGRKRGVIPLLETQRLAEVANNVINHTNVRFIGRIDAEEDFKRVARSMPPGAGLAQVQALERGTFYVPRLRPEPMHVRRRRVTHGGGTPDGGEVVARDKSISADLVRFLDRLPRIQPGEALTPLGASPTPSPSEVDELRERLANVTAALERTGRDFAEAVRQRDEARDRSEHDAQRLGEALQQLAQLDALRITFWAVFGQGAGPVFEGAVVAGTGLSESRVVELIRQHAQGGATVQLFPVEALRKRHLERAAIRLVQQVTELSSDARAVLLFMLGVPERGLTASQLAQGVYGYTGGAAAQNVKNGSGELVKLGLVEPYKSGNNRPYRLRVDTWIASALAPHNPTSQELAEVRDRALFVVLSTQGEEITT